MKKTTPNQKLKLDRITISTLGQSSLPGVVGGATGTRSVCAEQSCETDRYTQCKSRPMHCTNGC